jgi:FKBP-type peptidyl-prolyl cis-trans isomerase
MSKQNVIGVAVLFIVLTGIVGGAIWWEVRPKDSTNAQVQSVSTDNSTSADNSPSSLSAVSSAAVPLGNFSNSPSVQTNVGQQGTPMAQSNNAQGNQGQSSGGSNTSDKKTVDPSTFTQYEKYKNETNALFGEISQGTGASVDAGKTVSVQYHGWLTNGQTFDQNINPAKPFSFVLGAHTVIPGWEQGVAGMKVGGERLLIVPPSVGYGAQGQGPIPPNALLVFYVKVLSVN